MFAGEYLIQTSHSSLYTTISNIALDFFFQAEVGIRYLYVTGVQTCALPIFLELSGLLADLHHLRDHRREHGVLDQRLRDRHTFVHLRSHAGEGILDDPVARGLSGDL